VTNVVYTRHQTSENRYTIVGRRVNVELGVVGVRVSTDTMTGGNGELVSSVQEEQDRSEYTALWYSIADC